jgi:FMN-dependent NADH-azoreductase
MPTLLHLDSSPQGSSSITRRLTAEFVQTWRKTNPTGRVITRDLTATRLAPVDAAWIGAVHTPDTARTDAQKQGLTTSDALIAELEAADEYVLGVPMHNFSVPSTLKLWLDQIARAGKTFSYSSAGPAGLLKNKKATYIIATGGIYGVGTAGAALNFVEPYLRSVFAFLGVTDATFVTAGGAATVMQGKVDREVFLQPHIEAIQSKVASL